jgi:hypothetical protein
MDGAAPTEEGTKEEVMVVDAMRTAESELEVVSVTEEEEVVDLR